jgi:hypothetical protein
VVIASRPRVLLWIGAALAAISIPMMMLGNGNPDLPDASRNIAPVLVPANAVPLNKALARPLFSQRVVAPEAFADRTEDRDEAAGAPELVGVVGRLPDNAVALVRAEDGRMKSLGLRDSIDGWRLTALSIDAAFFTRGSERARVDLPAEP